jgi:hypothetical protein
MSVRRAGEAELIGPWLGVDVGGPRKGFDVAVVDASCVVALAGRLSCEDVVALAAEHRPHLIGIDSPRRCAPAGATSRACERELARRVCGIRWTPDAEHLHASGYYGWVVEGLRLYRALDRPAIEVFPTASWTRWHGPRRGWSRSAWSREALAALGLAGVSVRTNQDQRDAIAAALTAREHTAGRTEAIGDIVVPCGPSTRRTTP